MNRKVQGRFPSGNGLFFISKKQINTSTPWRRCIDLFDIKRLIWFNYFQTRLHIKSSHSEKPMEWWNMVSLGVGLALFLICGFIALFMAFIDGCSGNEEDKDLSSDEMKIFWGLMFSLALMIFGLWPAISYAIHHNLRELI